MPEAGETLAARAAGLLPPGCWTGSASPLRDYPLMTGEDVTGMVARRAAEFSAGRHAARLAMARAGYAPVAIPKAPDRAPIWPAGLVGSISHSDRACIAAVSERLRGIGLDIEPLRAFDPAVAALITAPGDLVCDAGADPGLLLFCAKEAVYKAQYPLSRQIFGPEALAVEITGDSLVARFRDAVPPFMAGARIAGRIVLCEGHVLALAWL